MGGNRARPHLLAGDREPALARPPGGVVLCFPMITMCMIDTHKKIQTKLKKKLHIALRSIWGGRLGSCPTPPRSRARPPRPRARASRGPGPGQRRAPGAASQAGGPRRRGRGPPGGVEGGLHASAGAWLANGSAPPDRERERPLAGALLPRRAALADSRRGEANRHARGTPWDGAWGRLTQGKRAPWPRAPGPMVR